MSEKELIPIYSPIDNTQILSMKVAVGDQVQKGSVLFTYKTNTGESMGVADNVMKSHLVGVVREFSVEEGSCVGKHDVIMFIEEYCDHRMVAFNLCAICGMDMKSDQQSPADGRLSMIPALPHVTVNKQEAHHLGNKDKQRLLNNRKLALIVDLDQTLIHTSVDRNIERGLPDVYGFSLPGHPYIYHCRLRPHVNEFLHSVSKLYELHVFTMATKDYAYAVTKILDPEKKLFSDRVISRDECFDPHSKAPRLKSVFPCGDEMVAIIDDREDVWCSCPNLVHVKPYVFFAGTSDINAPPPRPMPPAKTTMANDTSSSSHEDISRNVKNNSNNNNNNGGNNKGDESGSSDSSSDEDSSSSSDSSSEEESSTTQPDKPKQSSTAEDPSQDSVKPKLKIEDSDHFLIHLEHVLSQIHTTFYNEQDELKNAPPESSSLTSAAIRTPDLKEIIPRIRKKVFSDCNIAFSGVIPLGIPIERSREWNTTRAFGGTVHTDIVLPSVDTTDAITTHLVASKPDTVKYKQAKKIKTIKIVSPKWFWTSAEKWSRQPEELYQPSFESSSTDDNHSKKQLIKSADKQHTVHGTSMEGSKTMQPGTSYSRTFSVSSEELEKMEAEIDAELSSSDDDDDDDSVGGGSNNDGQQLGSYVQPPNDIDSRESFNEYLGITGDDDRDCYSRKRKRQDLEGGGLSSNSTSIDDDDSGSSDDDELAQLLMM